MKIVIDLEKESKEKLKLVKQLINESVPYDSTYDTETTTTRIMLVNAFMNLMVERIGRIVPEQDVVDLFKKIGIDKKKAELAIEDAKMHGLIYVVRQGFLQLI